MASTTYERTNQPPENWERLCKTGDAAIHLLVRELKILDHVNHLLRHMLRLEGTEAEDAIVSEYIAYLDPEG
jgi:hypothetical protein